MSGTDMKKTIEPATPATLLDATGAAALLGLTRGSLYNLRNAGDFAPAVVIGRGTLRWEPADLMAWARGKKEMAA